MVKQLLLMLMLMGGTAFAQDTFHVFPQIADGVAPDGSYYKSTVRVLPWFDSDAPSCTFRIYGTTVTLNNATSDTFNLNIPANGYYTATTAANQSLRTGYATLTCSKFVFAEILYSFYAPGGAKLGEAT